MDLSIDNHISKAYGIDNLLCPPQRSISLWCLAVIWILTAAAAFRAPHNAMGAPALVFVSGFMLASFWICRVQLNRLAKASDADLPVLRSLSATVLRITGTGLFALFAAVCWLK